MSKHISIFIPSLKFGGAERVMINLAIASSAHYSTVHLVTLSATAAELDANLGENVKVISLGVPRMLYAIHKLSKYLKSVKPAAIISALDYANIVVLLAANLSGTRTRVIVTEHSNLTASNERHGVGRRRLLPFLMRLFYPQAARVIAVSEGVAEDLIVNHGIQRASITTIYNPTISERLLELANEPCQHKYFATEDAPVLLAAGRLVAAKNFSNLIHAFALVRQKVDCKLVILGDGELRADLEKLVDQLQLNEYVDMPGFQRNPYSYMRNCDLFVSSSSWEGLSSVLIEALACGAKVVSTDCPSGPSEVLAGGRWGGLVEPDSPSALAKGIIDELNANRSFVGLQDHLRKFEASTVFQQYQEEIDGCISTI